MTKDAEEQPDEEMFRVKSESVPSTEPSVFVDFRCITLSVLGCVYQPRSSLNSILWVLLEASLHRHDCKHFRKKKIGENLWHLSRGRVLEATQS